jgi:hypothetical protein
MEHINPEGLRVFLRHVARVQKKITERGMARQKLQRKIQNLKRASIGAKTKRKIDVELAELNRHINEVIEKEKAIAGYAKRGDDVTNSLVNSLLVNSQKMDTVLDDVKKLEQKLDGFSKLKLDREVRMKVLEKKIGMSTTKKGASFELRTQLDKVVRHFEEVSKDPKYNPSDLNSIQNKINMIRLKLSTSL